MATVPTIPTQTAGTLATVAGFATPVQSAVSFMTTNKPRFFLRQTVAQSLTNNVFAAITFDTEGLDNDGGHSTSTNTSRYTAQTAGWLWVSGIACFAPSATNQRAAQLAINGTAVNGTFVQLLASNTGNTALSTGAMIFLNVGDYVELQALQQSTASLNTGVAAPNQSSMSGWWLGT